MRAGEEQPRDDPERGYWEHFQHQADIGVRGIAPTLPGAFAQAALALTAVVTDPERVVPLLPVPITCKAPDHEILLLDWLNALIYEMATRNMLFGRFEVEIDDHSLRATAWGEPVEVARHRPAVELKGATFTGLKVVRNPDGEWVAQCVVDV